MAVPFGRDNEAVQGVAARWETRNAGVADVTSWGEVSAIAPGHTTVTVQAGTARATVAVEVRDGARAKQKDLEWDIEHGNDCSDPEAASSGEPQAAASDDEDTSSTQSNLAFEKNLTPETLRTLVRPAMLRSQPQAAHKVVKTIAQRKVFGLGFYQAGFIIDGSSGDTFAPDALMYRNELGTVRFAAQETAQDGDENKQNLGSDNYIFTAPVLSLGGRGIGVNLALVYNSRLWNKDGSQMTFNYNKGWPAAGWSLGYGRIIQNYNNSGTGDLSGLGSGNAPGDFLLIQPDGSRVLLKQSFDSVSGWWKHDTTDGTFLHYNDRNGKLKYPDGTIVKYSAVNNRLLPTSIESHNGDLITIAYRNKTASFPVRWAIDSIVDTLGRVIRFNYDATSSALTSITAPDQNGATRTIVQIDYQNITLQYSFDPSLTLETGTPSSGSQLGVVRRIYYPATGRGYVFLNYSGYGMAKKISSRIGMTALSDGTEVAYTEYTYLDTGALMDSPQFTERKEWWQGKTDANGVADSTATLYTYSRSTGTVTETETVSDQSLDVATTIDTDPNSLTNGKVLSVIYKNHSTGAVLREIDYNYTSPVDGGMQIGSVIAYNEVTGQKTKVGYDYGDYGRVTNVYEYGLPESGSFKTRRRTAYTYSDDPNVGGPGMTQMITEIDVYDALLDNINTNDVLKAKAVFTYDNYGVKGGMEFYGLTSASYPPNHDATYDQNKTGRGNVTGVQTWSDIAGNVSATRYTKYDIFGNTVEADVSCCQVKTFAFNSTNYYSQPVQTTDGRNGVVPFLSTSYSYDFNTGLVTQATDPNNLMTSFIYDAAWRLTRINSPSGAYTTTSFDKDGNGNDLLSFTEQANYTENGASKVITNKSWFDGAGRVLKAGSGAGSAPASYDMVSIVYDKLGRVSKQSNPYAGDSAGNGTPQYWTVSTYDELSRVTIVTLADNQTIRTSYSGVTTTVTDQVGRKRQSEVDGLGRVVKVVEQNPATGALDSVNYLTTYSYDVLNNLTQVNQGSQTRSFSYDALSRLISQTTPEAGTESLSYYDSNQLKKRVDARSVEAHYKYDSLNRPIQVWHTGAGGDDAGSIRPALPAGVAATSDVTISYNNFTSSQAGNGQVSSVTDSAGTESYSYDTLARLATKTRVMDARSYQSQYLYNTAGQMTTLVYPSGKRVRVNHDSRGRMSGLDKVDSLGNVLGQYVSSVGYNTAGQVTSLGLANGVSESYGYSADRLQLTSQSAVKGASTLMSLTYGYQAGAGASGAATTAGNSGQLISIGGTVNGFSRSESYSYDNVGRLATATGWNWQRRYSYDRWGNRIGMWDAVVGGNQLQSIVIQPGGSAVNNRVQSINAVSYSYDASGNVTGDGVRSYSYDGEGRQVSVNGGAVSTSVYDSSNRRVKKTAGGVTTHYIWEGSQVIAEYNASTGALISEYIYAGSRMVARDQGGVVRYFHQDRLSTRLITDGNGTVVGTEDHLPFGEDLAVTGESEKHRFTTYERDSESGSDYAINRQHSFSAGRFMQPDPMAGSIGDPQSLNRFAYSLNDPTNLVDPLGLQTCKIDWMDAPCMMALSLLQSGAGVQYNGNSIVNLGGILAPIQFDANGVITAYIRVAMNSPMHGMTSTVITEDGKYDQVYTIGVMETTIKVVVNIRGLPYQIQAEFGFHEPGVETDWGTQLLIGGGLASTITRVAGIGGGAAVAQGETVTVSRWGREGLQSGDWVMKGEATRWNYIRSFKWQPGMGNQFAPFKSGASYTVPASSVRWPSGWGIDGWWKGVFGQRIYKPQ